MPGQLCLPGKPYLPGQPWLPGQPGLPCLPGQPYQYQVVTDEAGRPVQASGQMM